MVIDCHVHTCEFAPEDGWTSDALLSTIALRFMRWRLKLKGADAQTERDLEARLFQTLDGTPELDAAVILAFDAVHNSAGQLDRDRTHFYVRNDYIRDLARRHPKILYGCSIHPYRKDAVRELERCIADGAVLLKWLPITQDFSPDDPRCYPLYECLAHHGFPLLCHSGGEQSLPQMAPETADPRLLIPALKMGVTVIAAHCGTRSTFTSPDFVIETIDLCHQFEKLYCDTSALNLPTRWHAYAMMRKDPIASTRLVHGSDWPIYPISNPRAVGTAAFFGHLAQQNWMRRDIQIKQSLEMDPEYWHRCARVLKITAGAAADHPVASNPIAP